MQNTAAKFELNPSMIDLSTASDLKVAYNPSHLQQSTTYALKVRSMASSSKARHWKNAPYAVVVPESEKKRDIIPASPNLARATKYPFGVCISSERIPFYETPLPLIYVSPEAALDRAPGKHSTNGRGVRSGWYVIAQPGRFNVWATRFKHVRMSPRQRRLADNAFSLRLEVDGLRTCQGRHIFDRSKVRDVVFTGFVERREKRHGTHNARTAVLRPFVFEKVAAVEDLPQGTCHVGEIRLTVKSGIKKNFMVETETRAYDYSKNAVSEKLVAKEGRSIQASRNVAKEEYISENSTWHVAHKLEIEEAGITIFVRERSWLHSRHIIDDDGLPVSYETFAAMLRADKVRVRDIGFVDVDGEPAKKRRKIKEQMRLSDEFEHVQPGEIIDLT